jgi:protein SCO1/2
MKRNFLNRWCWAVTLLAGCSGQPSAIPYYNTPDFTPLFLTKAQADQRVTHAVPGFSFTDQHGKAITRQEMQGKIYVASFFFTRCSGICPVMMQQLSRVARSFRSDTNVLILSHTVTPGSDSVPVLRQYAADKQMKYPGWHLLTGNREAIYTLARKGYFADERLGFSKDTSEFLHTENFILVDAKGKIRGVYNGTLELETNELMADIRVLQREQMKGN